MELGICTFADVQPDRKAGRAMNTHQRIKDLMEEIQLADELGLDIFAVGEHHRPDYAVSSPATILSAAAMVTKNIRLSSAVTVLSSDDPVRVFQQFATVDLLSGGRAEIMAGCGSFIESFPLFGYDLKDYDDLFGEKLDLLMKINSAKVISWQGKFRAPIEDLGIYPRPYQEKLPIWLAVGGTPESAIRAAKLGLPMMLAIIGGMPERFVPFINLYKQADREQGRSVPLPLGINSHTYVAAGSQQAKDEFYPPYSAMMNRIGKERGWQPMGRDHFEAGCSPRGWLLVGSVQEVIEKILFEHEIFGHTRFLAQMSVGVMPHENIMKSMELFGTQVVPVIRRSLGQEAGGRR